LPLHAATSRSTPYTATPDVPEAAKYRRLRREVRALLRQNATHRIELRRVQDLVFEATEHRLALVHRLMKHEDLLSLTPSILNPGAKKVQPVSAPPKQQQQQLSSPTGHHAATLKKSPQDTVIHTTSATRHPVAV